MTIIFGDKKSIPLNSLEKFILSHESAYISYNSQLCVEFKGEFNLQKLIDSVDVCINEIPLLRSTISEGLFQFKRSYKSQINLNAKDVIRFQNKILDQVEIDAFCQKKFNLEEAPLFRISVSRTTEDKFLFIFNIHHTICDAAGQFHIMEEIFRVMNGEPVRKEARTDKVFQYRQLAKYMGWSWVLKNIKEQFRPLSKQRMYSMATLIDYPDRPERFVTSRTIYLTSDEQEKILRECKKREISITEYLTTNCFRAMDTSLIRRGDLKTPIMVYLPKTLRPFLKLRYSLQNILSTVLIVGKRDEIHDEKFFAKVKHIVGSHKMDKAAKFIFSTLLPTAITPPKKIKEIYFNYDQKSHAITSSLLISAGRVPRSYTFPNGWSEITVWARGVMLKSPGVGVVFTGVAGSETITIEYLKDLTDSKTIDHFENDLMAALLSD